jgi:hypothetical protein
MQALLSSHRSRVLFLGFIFLFFLSTKSQAASPALDSDCNQAQQLVEKFVKLDAEIGRLSTEAYKKYFDSMILYKIDGKIVHEEPGWDASSVIRSYQVKGCRVEADTSWVKVSYEVLGEDTSDSTGKCPTFIPSKRTDTVEFEVKKIKSALKIAPPTGPHVSAERTIALLGENKTSCPKEKAAEILQIQEALAQKAK